MWRTSLVAIAALTLCCACGAKATPEQGAGDVLREARLVLRNLANAKTGFRIGVEAAPVLESVQADAVTIYGRSWVPLAKSGLGVPDARDGLVHFRHTDAEGEVTALVYAIEITWPLAGGDADATYAALKSELEAMKYVVTPLQRSGSRVMRGTRRLEDGIERDLYVAVLDGHLYVEGSDNGRMGALPFKAGR